MNHNDVRPAFLAAAVAVAAVVVAGITAACGTSTLALVDPPPASEGEGEGGVEGEGAGEGEGVDVCADFPLDQDSPVKVLFVIDISGSMQFTDAGDDRLVLLRNAIASLVDRTNAQVAVMGFGADVYVEPLHDSPTSPLFEPAQQYVEPSFISAKDVATDMHLALSRAREHILLDLLRTPPEDVGATRYSVVILTDGTPDPRCCRATDIVVADGSEESNNAIVAGDPTECALELWEEPTVDASYCEGVVQPSYCTSQDALDNFRTNQPDVVGATGTPDYGEGVVPPLADLIVGHDYNRLADLRDDAFLFQGLAETFATTIDLRFVLLTDPTLPNNVKQIFALNQCRMRTTLDSLAEASAGTSASLFDDALVDESTFAPTCAAGR